MSPDFDILEEQDVSILNELLHNATLTLHNDDYNTFDHVITCLVIYCGHTPMQAEQCALIVHNNGKCDIKNGTYGEIVRLYKVLLQENLTVTYDIVP